MSYGVRFPSHTKYTHRFPSIPWHVAKEMSHTVTQISDRDQSKINRMGVDMVGLVCLLKGFKIHEVAPFSKVSGECLQIMHPGGAHTGVGMIQDPLPTHTLSMSLFSGNRITPQLLS